MRKRKLEVDDVFNLFYEKKYFTPEIILILEDYVTAIFYEMLAMNYLHIDIFSIINDLKHNSQYFKILNYYMKFDIVFYEYDNDLCTLYLYDITDYLGSFTKKSIIYNKSFNLSYNNIFKEINIIFEKLEKRFNLEPLDI